MNKEEILERSPASQNDEVTNYVRDQGRKIGFYIFNIVAIIIAISSIFLSEEGVQTPPL